MGYSRGESLDDTLYKDSGWKILWLSKKISEFIVRKKGDIEFLVRDSGIGVPKESIQKITTSFFQANQNVSTKGFGIGLTICKKIIEAHKGRLSIESEKGIGSAFILHLPSK